MKNLSKFLILIIIMNINSSCKKDSSNKVTEFSGVVLSYDSGEPLNNVLIEIERNDGVLDNSIIGIIKDTVRTNSKGEYNFLALDNIKEWYDVNAIMKDYTTGYKSINIIRKINQNAENKDTIKLGISTYLKLNLLNNRLNDYDSLYIKIEGEPIVGDNSVGVVAPQIFRLYPQYEDTTLTITLLYEYFHHTKVTWKVTDCTSSIDNIVNIITIPKNISELEIEF